MFAFNIQSLWSCSLHTERRRSLHKNHLNRDNSRVDPLHLYSLLTINNFCALRNYVQMSSIASCSCAIDRMSRYFVHGVCRSISSSTLFSSYALLP